MTNSLVRMFGSVFPVAMAMAMAMVLAAPATANGPPSEPYMILRKIMAAQDQVSHGDTSAPQRQKALQEEASQLFEALPDDVWQKPRNALTAALFMIVGGSSLTFRGLLSKGIGFGKHEDFVKGAIAYRERNFADAKKKFLLVETRTLDRIPAACLHLVKAILKSNDEQKQAVENFVMVSTLVPGGYLEDTAIRLQASLALAHKEHDVFLSVISRYLRRFPRSLYAVPFLKNASKAILNLNDNDISSVAEKQVKVFEKVPSRVRISFLLSVAETALRSGKLNSARTFAEAAQRIGTNNSKLAIASELYIAAASVFSEASLAGQIAEKYQSRRNNLRSSDGEFADAIAAVIQQVRAPATIDPGRNFTPGPASIEARKLVAWSQNLLSIGRVRQK